jgi:phosphatidylglycerol:prolipoprotein diacylglycerol transferase
MNQLLFESRIFTIYSIWFFISLALFAGTYLFVKLAQKSRLRLQFIADVSIPVIIYSIVIGRIFAIFSNAQYYFYDFGAAKIYQMIAFWQDKDISFWGAMIGAIYIFTKKANQKQENLQKWGDIFAISLMLSLFIGNFGALLDGSNHGSPTSFPWGIAFDNSIVKFTTPIHPTQVYAMIYCLIIGILAYKIDKKYKNQFDGLVMLLTSALFSSFKVLEGFFRGDDVTMLWIFRFPELCFFIIALYSWHKLYFFQKRNQVPFLRKFDYYYGKMLNILHLKK